MKAGFGKNLSIEDLRNKDWQWQLRNAVTDVNQLICLLPKKTPDTEQWLKENFGLASLPFSLTPYFLSLMDGSQNCPIFAQVVSSKKENMPDPYQFLDPLGEEPRAKVPHLVHRYPDRVLFLATDRCASYCRFCTRKRWVGQGPSPKKDEQNQAFDYIAKNTKIREIIFSGGDPLMLSNNRIENLLEKAFAIKHIEVVRFHSRMLSFAPMRIDDELCKIFAKFSPIYIVNHFNHPHEITEYSIQAMKSLHNSGVSLLNQSVLLNSINDEPEILSTLFRLLVRNHVRPYYLHQCDVVEGARHFRVPLKKSLSIMEKLRGHISGLCMPTLVIDIPHGHGKVPLVPNPIVREDNSYYYLKGFDGQIAAYPKDEI